MQQSTWNIPYHILTCMNQSFKYYQLLQIHHHSSVLGSKIPISLTLSIEHSNHDQENLANFHVALSKRHQKMTLLTRFLACLSVLPALVHGEAARAAVAQQAGGPINVAEDGTRTVPLRTHTLFSPYLDSDLQSRWYVFCSGLS
jgi:hypothetical protein